MNAIVIVVEGVGTRLVGAYGNSSAVTPMLDQMAARGLLLDNCYLDSLELRLQLSSLWTGRHASQTSATDWTIWKELATRHIPAKLITDCSDVAEIAQELGCSDIVYVKVPSADQLADEPEQCAVSEVFSAAIDELGQFHSGGLVWIHSRGLRHPWDAPQDLRTRMTDPDDPEPPTDPVAPMFRVDSETDPDLVVGWGQVASAQVAVIDQAIEGLYLSIQTRDDAERWSWLVTSLGGYPLGEHGQIGFLQRQLHHEELAVPMIAISARMQSHAIRRGEICQLPDVCALLLECLGIDPSASIWGHSLMTTGAPSAPFDWQRGHTLAWLGDAHRGWIRTPAWSLIIGDDVQPKLFVKPDDRWEVNDVVSLRREMVEEMKELLRLAIQAAEINDRNSLPVVNRDLCNYSR